MPWVYLTLGIIGALIVLGAVAINTALQRTNFHDFIDAKLTAVRVSEDAEKGDVVKKSEYVPVSPTLLDKNQRLVQALEGADYRYVIISKGGQLAQNVQIDRAQEVTITEEEANRLISIWKSYFISSEVDRQVYGNFVINNHFIKIQLEDKFYDITITVVYKQ